MTADYLMCDVSFVIGDVRFVMCDARFVCVIYGLLFKNTFIESG